MICTYTIINTFPVSLQLFWEFAFIYSKVEKKNVSVEMIIYICKCLVTSLIIIIIADNLTLTIYVLVFLDFISSVSTHFWQSEDLNTAHHLYYQHLFHKIWRVRPLKVHSAVPRGVMSERLHNQLRASNGDKMDHEMVKTNHPIGVLRIHGQLKPLEREEKEQTWACWVIAIKRQCLWGFCWDVAVP